jgi:hypothetical protein
VVRQDLLRLRNDGRRLVNTHKKNFQFAVQVVSP